MKYFLILLIFISSFTSCENKSPKRKLDIYMDSFYYFNDKFICFTLCKKYDSADIMFKEQNRASDSADKFYYILYPSDKTNTPKPNCNCK